MLMIQNHICHRKYILGRVVWKATHKKMYIRGYEMSCDFIGVMNIRNFLEIVPTLKVI